MLKKAIGVIWLSSYIFAQLSGLNIQSDPIKNYFNRTNSNLIFNNCHDSIISMIFGIDDNDIRLIRCDGLDNAYSPAIHDYVLFINDDKKNNESLKLLKTFGAESKFALIDEQIITSEWRVLLRQFIYYQVIKHQSKNIIYISNYLDPQLLFSQSINDKKADIVVLIPSYNNSSVYKKNLDSIVSQKYKNFRIIYIDDASTDDTANLVEQYLLTYCNMISVTIIKNKDRRGALANIFNAVHLCDKKEIVVCVDGDDWLINDNVLENVFNIYQNTNTWITYGRFIYYPQNTLGNTNKIPEELIKTNQIRTHYWGGTTPLRTFYAGLFHQIKPIDLIFQGNFYPMAWDLAMMFPMLEMAGIHSYFIEEPYYVYNVDNAINDHKVNANLQAELDRHTRIKLKYNPLKSLTID